MLLARSVCLTSDVHLHHRQACFGLCCCADYNLDVDSRGVCLGASCRGSALLNVAVIAQLCMQLCTNLGLTQVVASQRQQDNGPTSPVGCLS